MSLTSISLAFLLMSTYWVEMAAWSSEAGRPDPQQSTRQRRRGTCQLSCSRPRGRRRPRCCTPPARWCSSRGPWGPPRTTAPDDPLVTAHVLVDFPAEVFFAICGALGQELLCLLLIGCVLEVEGVAAVEVVV